MKHLKILLVDDDEDDMQFFADALEIIDLHTHLTTVTNGQECLDYLRGYKTQRPDLIFLDLNMPIMNGMQCLENIRDDATLNDSVVAIFSTSSSERDIELTFEKGANIYITKPSSFEDLKNSLIQVFNTNWADRSVHMNRENYLLNV